MTGPEHYHQAEYYLACVTHAVSEPDDGWEDPDRLVAKAQVHATLALAAAYAEVNPTSAWHEVAGPEAEDEDPS